MKFPHIKDKDNTGGFRGRMKRMFHRTTFGAVSLVAAAPLFFAPMASAAAPVVVTPANTQGWYVADQRAGGAYAYVNDPSSPLPTGALQLTTDSNTASKIQYMHDTATPLSSVTSLSYATRQVSGPPEADPSYQLAVCLNGVTAGTCNGFTTLVYEPYWNGPVTPGVWQTWDVANGLFWSSRTVAPIVVAAPGGPPTYTLAALKAAYPNAVVTSYGVNVGTYNLNYNVRTDAFNFNGTVYNFEQTNQPSDKDQCKNDGYKNFTDANGNAFKNQGQCVSYTNGRGQNSVVLSDF